MSKQRQKLSLNKEAPVAQTGELPPPTVAAEEETPRPALKPVPQPASGMFIRMNSGNKFRYDDIASNTFNLHDFAHNLAKLHRFLGAPDEDYNVAQHSCLVSDYLLAHTAPHIAFYGLIHDFPEAVIGDVVTPQKRWMLSLGFDFEKHMHDPVDKLVHNKIGMPYPLPADIRSLVDDADFVLYQAEGRNLVKGFAGSPLPQHAPPYNHKITVWSRKESYRQLIARFNRLLPLALPFGALHGRANNSAA